jgi:hypothetical protein
MGFSFAFLTTFTSSPRAERVDRVFHASKLFNYQTVNLFQRERSAPQTPAVIQFTKIIELLQEKKRRRRIYYANFANLKQRVNERRQGRALRQHDQQAQHEHDEQNRAQPPFFAHAHKGPKLAEN